MKTLLGIPVDKIDALKYIMQLRCIITWTRSGARGTIEAATGFGKSIIGCLAIAKMVKLNSNRHALIIVPTTQLKAQWEGILKAFGLSTNTTVMVINSIALKNQKYKVDLLIVDEIHMMAADKFSRLFSLVDYKWILGLTATIDRLDGKEALLKKYAPVIYTISQSLAIEKGWINDFIELNVPVFLTRHEKDKLTNLSKQIRHFAAKFGDFDIMRSCMNSDNAYAYALQYYPTQDPKEKSKEIVRDAVQGQRCVQERQSFLYKTEHKVNATVDLINEFGYKTITFSQSTQFADEVKNAVGRRAVAYHSNLETKHVQITKTKEYKRQESADRFAETVNGKSQYVNGIYKVKYKTTKKQGPTARKKDALERFTNSSHGVDVVCTAKALDQGFDVPDVVLGVDASRTTNPTQHTQRTGRIARKHTYADGTEKQGVYVNLFIPNSQDEKWLRKCQKNSQNVAWLQDMDECINLLKKVL
jgi:superfamily II DNA or RNA helicase